MQTIRYHAIRIFLFLSCTGITVFGYSYNAWNGLTPERTLFVNPFLSTSSVLVTNAPVTLSADLVGAYGTTKNADIFVSLAMIGVTPTLQFFNWVMPRFAITPNHIIAIQVGSTFAAPQYHFFWENDAFALEANIIARMPFSDVRTSTVSAIIAPVWKAVKDTFAVYVEIDPAMTFSPTAPNVRLTGTIIPGVWFGIPGTTFQTSLGASFNGLGTGTQWGLGIVAWFAYSFPLK